MKIPTTTPGALSRLLAALAACALVLALPVAAGAADPKRYRPYYTLFDRGKAKIPGHDTRWIPQDLTYWPQQDALSSPATTASTPRTAGSPSSTATAADSVSTRQ